MTGQDWVAAILALAVAAVLVIVTLGIVLGAYHVTGEGVLGAIVGALIVAVVRYIGTDRRTRP